MSVDIVIGANYGDESKGLATAKIAKSYNDYDNTIEINQYNEWQHDFNYSKLDIKDLKRRLDIEAKKANVNNYILEVTHCDEIDNEEKFKKNFSNVNFYDTNKL